MRPDIPQLANELAELKIDYEILSAKHELTLAELQKKVDKAASSLDDSVHSCLEQTKVIGSLEASNADLVSFNTSSLQRLATSLTFTEFSFLFLFICQVSTRAHLSTILHETQISNSTLEKEVDVLKSGIEEIVQLAREREEDKAISEKGPFIIPVRTRRRELSQPVRMLPTLEEVISDPLGYGYISNPDHRTCR